MGDALANFATTGKLDFRGLVTSILGDLAKMEMRIAMSKILQSIIGGGSDGAGGQMASVFDGGWGGVAKGAAFDGSVTPFASGGVVSSPHLFASGG